MYKVIEYKNLYFIRKKEVEGELKGYEESNFCGFDFDISIDLGMNISVYCTIMEEEYDAYEGFYGIYFKDIKNAYRALDWIESILLMRELE